MNAITRLAQIDRAAQLVASLKKLAHEERRYQEGRLHQLHDPQERDRLILEQIEELHDLVFPVADNPA